MALLVEKVVEEKSDIVSSKQRLLYWTEPDRSRFAGLTLDSQEGVPHSRWNHPKEANPAASGITVTGLSFVTIVSPATGE